MKPWDFDITGEGDKALEHALRYIEAGHYNPFSVSHWGEFGIKNHDDYEGHLDNDPDGHVTLFLGTEHYKEPGNKLPFTYDFNETLVFLKGWLKRADAGEVPDTDGSVNRGWRLFNQYPPKTGCYPVLALQAVWVIYGK